MLRKLAILGFLVAAAGCTVNPSGPPASGPRATAPTSPSPTLVGSASPAATAPIASSGIIDQKLTTPALEFRSTGTHLIWSTGARADKTGDVAPDLYASEPGGVAKLIYDNPNRDSRLEYLDGNGTRFAFIEINSRVFGQGGWKLWYMPSLEATPTLVDEGASQLPFFSISDDFLVWSVVHGPPEESQLLSLDLGSMERRVLASKSPNQVQFWFPDVDGTRVVYGTVEPQADLSSDQRHIYLLDVGAKAAALRLDKGTSASEPVILGNDVVWKESDPHLNFLVAGSLVHYSIDSREQEPLQLPTEGNLGFVEPSIGDGFATAWPQSDRRLYIADLERGTYLPILDLGRTDDDPHDAVARPDLSGDLLAYVFGPAHGELELRWVTLRR